MAKYIHKFDTIEQANNYLDNQYEEPFVGVLNSYVNYNFYGLNGHDYVDLGLFSRTIWATCNVGASSPEEYGDYFSWGEVETKSAYTQANYIYGNTQNGSNITKYNDSDNLYILEPQDDAAFVNMGGRWHMPSEAQVQELIGNTTQTWETLNGINGMRFTGANGKSIFIPAGGNKFNSTSAGIGTFGVIWTSDRYDLTSARGVSISSGDTHIANYLKDGGKMIRGVIGYKIMAPIEPR